jgi:predicted type IV restriction endonuclease
MTTVLAISDEIKTLGQVESKLGISLTEDSEFFLEWLAAMPELEVDDRLRLDQVRRNYLYQSADGVLLEETVKMVILSPLLELAGFYQAPYKFRAEVGVEISAIGDNDEVLRGRIDALVLQEQLWIVLIEAKKTSFNVELALAQTLTYMAAALDRTKPVYGMVTNGSHYLFVKLLGQQYGVSDLFATRSQHRNNLYEVLQILKFLGGLIR